MKSKFYLAFILAGIVPVVGLAGFYLYTALNTEMSAASAPAAPAAVAVNPAQQESEVETIASSLFNAIKSTNVDASNLNAYHAPADLDNFVRSHNGVSGVVLLDPTGKAVRTMPDTPALVDANYGSNPEFAKVQEKFKENGGNNYQFYTNRLGYPAFIFAVPLPSGYLAEVVLNITQFFRGASANGMFFILDANSGHFLYHSDASKLSSEFNPQHEGWLNQVTAGLMAQKNGVSSGPSMGAAYSWLGFGKFGVVHLFPLTVPGAPSAARSAVKPDLTDSVMTPMALGFVIAVALLCIGAAIASRMLAAPFRRATGVILAAADDPATLTPEIVKSFGNDEAGQIVQALHLLNEKFQEKKDAAIRSLNDQVSGLQRQSRQYQSEAAEKTQQMADKLKELDALKGMAEGLRNQSEQAKNEVARLKADLTSAQAVQVEFTALQNKMTLLQAQLKTAETKAAQAAAAASSVQVSQVRAAAIRTMAEELKNTLGIIKGYVSSVIGAGQGGINEKQQEFLGMVINRSARLEKFINDLVDMYQVEIEQKDAKVDMVDLPKEIETLAFNFQTQTELKNLKFKVEAKPGLSKVPVVKRRLTQLWNVLYLQLIKDAPKGTTIPIVVEAVGDNVRVTLHDPGLNVTAEGLPKMFDEFYDPKHPASPQLAGTGLKLSLVKTILTAHGGSARAEKAEPGTRIVLTFATKRGADSAVTPEPAPISGPPPISAPAGLKPAIPTTPGAPAAKPALDLNNAFGVGAASKPVTPAPGTPATPTPAAPAASAPVVPAKPAGGVLDALISGKIPSVTAPGLKPAVPPAATPSAPVTPAAPATPATPTPGVPGITVGAKPPAGAPGAPPPPPSGITVGAKPPSAGPSSGPSVPIAPPAGLSVGSKIPGMEAPKAPAAPLPPIPGLTVGAKPPSAGPTPGAPVPPPAAKAPVPGAPPVPGVPPVPKAPAPPTPGTPAPGAPKPPAVSLDSLLNQTPKPGVPPAAPGAPPNIQKPTAPPVPKPPAGDDLLE